MAKKMKRVRKQQAQLTEAEQKELALKERRELLKHCTIYKTKDAPVNTWRVESLPVQRLVDKVTRDHNVTVCRAWFDLPTKSVFAVHAVNAHDTKEVSFSFDDICNWYGWKSFSVSKDQQSIKPKW